MDRVETTGTVWMGLTFNCCRCHDHKFDPLTQREYYQLSAYFNSIDETRRRTTSAVYAKPVLSLALAGGAGEGRRRCKAAEAQAKKERDELEKKLRAEQPAWEQSVIAGDGGELGRSRVAGADARRK